MIALYIIIILLLVVFLMLFSPISVFIESHGDFAVCVFFLGIKIFDSSIKKKNNRKKGEETQKVQKKQEKNENKIFSLYKKQKEKSGTVGAIKYFCKISKSVFEKLLWFIKKLDIDNMTFNLVVATDNAADTAIKYGVVCTAIYPILSLITANASVKYKKINISADFNKTAIIFDLSLFIRVKLIYAVIGAFKGYKEYNKIIKDEENNG